MVIFHAELSNKQKVYQNHETTKCIESALIVEFREPWFLEENKWWKPPWSGISVENYLGVKTHQRTRFKPWWFHEGLPSYMCQ